MLSKDDQRTRQLAVRLPARLLERVEAHAERLRRAAPGARLTRADGLRVLLTLALDVVEREHEARHEEKR